MNLDTLYSDLTLKTDAKLALVVLLVVVWVVAERANPKMIQTDETSRPMK